jgi:hypothetical protein
MSFNSPLTKILNAIFVDKNIIQDCNFDELKKYGFIINRQLSIMNIEIGDALNDPSIPTELIPIIWWTYTSRKMSVPPRAYPMNKKKIAHSNDSERDIEKLLREQI